MNTNPILISLTREVQELLADNGIDLVEELKKEIPEISKDQRSDPTIGEDNQTRDITLIILASSAAVYAISMGIEKIINALGNRPARIERTELVPVIDPKGEVVLDKTGQPILQWVTKTDIVEPKKPVEEEGKSTFSWLGLKVELQNKRKQG